MMPLSRLCLLLLALLVPSSRAAGAPAAARPNILWLVAEELGPHLGCGGTRQVWTPNLDRLTPAQETLCRPRMPDEELYDLETDPWEINNLAGQPQHQATLQRLRGVLERWIEDSHDQGRTPEPAGPAARPAKPERKRAPAPAAAGG